MNEAPPRREESGVLRPVVQPNAFLPLARITIVVALAVLLLWFVADILLLIFAGILLALLLRGLSEWLNRRSRLPMGWSLAAVVLAILVIIAAVDYFLAPRVSREFDELLRQMPAEIHRIALHLGQSSWGRSIVQEFEPGTGSMSVKAVAGGFFGVATTAVTAIVAVIVVLFIGLYGSADPDVYVTGFVRLVPLTRRARAREVLGEMAHALRWWLIGRLISMGIIAVLTGAGLWLLGVPIALTLGLVAGALSFVPYVGSISSAIPAILIALTQGTAQMLYVIVLYVVVHVVEGYILVPLMQRKMVHLPPALTLSMQAIFGALLGIIGIALATPVTAAVMVATRLLYVEDVLHDRSTDSVLER